MDPYHRAPMKNKEDEWEPSIDNQYDLWDHRYEHSVLRLLHTQDLPNLSSISRFSGDLHCPRAVEPRSIAAIAAKLDNLRCVDWSLKDKEKKDRQMQQDDRNNFVQALSTLVQLSLKTFRLNYYNEAPSNQSFDLHSFVPQSKLSQDNLSLALHKLSQSPNMTEVVLDGPIVISPILFWPINPQTAPLWPALTNFHITFNVTTPNGEWYFVRDPLRGEVADEEEDSEAEDESEDDATSDDSWAEFCANDPLVPDTFNEKKESRAVGDSPIRIFRTMPDSEKITPLLTAMARAAGQMPKLQRLSLTADLVCSDACFQLSYFAPGEESRLDRELADDREKPRLYWHLGNGHWRPEEEVLLLWREAKGVDGEMVVRFVEW